MRSGLVRSAGILSVVGALGLASQGCSISKALNGPSPVAVEKVKVGENRNTIISTLGIPKQTETKADNSKTEVYEFVDGHSNGSKLRVILYIAGDVFTLGLTELLFWPIELAAGDGTHGRAIIGYGQDEVARSVLLTKSDGSPWPSSTPEPAEATPGNAPAFLTGASSAGETAPGTTPAAAKPAPSPAPAATEIAPSAAPAAAETRPGPAPAAAKPAPGPAPAATGTTPAASGTTAPASVVAK